MIAAHLFDEPVVLGLRSAYRGSASPAVLIPGAIDPATAAALREAVTPQLQEIFVADRGRYLTRAAPPELPLAEELRLLASRIVAVPLELAEARWLIFRGGDYALFKDGAPLPACVEVTLDFSAAEVAGGEVVYARGPETLLALPSSPRSLAIVERPAGVVRQTRYLPLKQGPAAVHRLRLVLAAR